MLSKINFFFLTCILITSCDIDSFVSAPEPEQIQFADVDRALWPYFQAFQEEGERRGVSIDLAISNISGEIAVIEEEGVAGTCLYGSHITNHVTIDQAYWLRARDIEREYVVFHELGHCFLLRDHNDDFDRNGICVSVMHSGLTSCRNAYNITNRDYYLDELFSEINGM